MHTNSQYRYELLQAESLKLKLRYQQKSENLTVLILHKVDDLIEVLDWTVKCSFIFWIYVHKTTEHYLYFCFYFPCHFIFGQRNKDAFLCFKHPVTLCQTLIHVPGETNKFWENPDGISSEIWKCHCYCGLLDFPAVRTCQVNLTKPSWSLVPSSLKEVTKHLGCFLGAVVTQVPASCVIQCSLLHLERKVQFYLFMPKEGMFTLWKQRKEKPKSERPTRPM